METHFEKTLESQTVYEGRVITVTRDTALLEDGTTALRDVVHHHGGACILPYYEDGTICMVRQFRYAMQQELWELPAGKLDAGEDPFEAATRELTEECGVCADEYISLGEIYPTVGYDPRSSTSGPPAVSTPPPCTWTPTSSSPPSGCPSQKPTRWSSRARSRTPKRSPASSNSKPCWTIGKSEKFHTCKKLPFRPVREGSFFDSIFR